MTQIDTITSLAGLLMLLRCEWTPEGDNVELSLRSSIAHEIASALETALPMLMGVKGWPEEPDA